jgi:hypothetical protein
MAITPTMLINRSPHKPLSPFKVRRRGANAFWTTVKKHYTKYAGSAEREQREREKHDRSYHAPKTQTHRAGEQVTGAFIKGWKDVWLDIAVDATRWQSYVERWATSEARPDHLHDAYIAGREFYYEQFPEGSAKPVLHPQRLET